MKPLGDYAANRYSQCGEDGILERVFSLLGIVDGWCVEFGAWDGQHLSNTASLLRHGHWRGVLIEADPARFVDLENNMRPYPLVTCLNRLVGVDGADSLDSLLGTSDLAPDFDLLSIDIDGNDYHVWDALTGYHPKVVVIEFNPTIPNHVEFVQPSDFSLNQGNSLLSLTGLAGRKGYELAAVTLTNGIFVRGDLFPALGVEDNSLDHLRPSRDMQTSLFQLYDGTLVLDGMKALYWHDMLPISPERIQVVPRMLRRFPGSAPRPVRFVQRGWRGYERGRQLLRRVLVDRR